MINFPFRIVQASLSDLCSFQDSGNTQSVLNGSGQGEVTEPIAVPAEDTQSSLAQGDTSVSENKPELSTEQPADMEVSEAPLEETHLVHVETSSLGKLLMKLW
jgi:hypothetical protein